MKAPISRRILLLRDRNVWRINRRAWLRYLQRIRDDEETELRQYAEHLGLLVADVTEITPSIARMLMSIVRTVPSSTPTGEAER